MSNGLVLEPALSIILISMDVLHKINKQFFELRRVLSGDVIVTMAHLTSCPNICKFEYLTAAASDAVSVFEF